MFILRPNTSESVKGKKSKFFKIFGTLRTYYRHCSSFVHWPENCLDCLGQINRENDALF